MNFRSLISTDNKKLSFSRVGTWLAFIVILITSYLYFINNINTETYKNVVGDWRWVLSTFIMYQGISNVSRKKYNKDNNESGDNQ